MLGLKFHNNIYVSITELVYRGRETQIQVTENLKWIAQWSKGDHHYYYV